MQVLSEKREGLLAERIEPLFSPEPIAQVGLARADPHLLFSCAILARRRNRGARDEHEQYNRAAPCHAGGEVHRLLPLFLTGSQHGALRILHCRDQASNPVHAGLGAIGSRDVCRSLGAAGAPHCDGLGTQGHPVVGELLQGRNPLLLFRIGAQLRSKGRERSPKGGTPRRVGLEVSLVTREQKSALTGLGVLDAGEELFEALYGVERLRDSRRSDRSRHQRAVREQGDQHDSQDRDEEASQGIGRQKARGACAAARLARPQSSSHG